MRFLAFLSAPCGPQWSSMVNLNRIGLKTPLGRHEYETQKKW
jgi:hypothetical protein